VIHQSFDFTMSNVPTGRSANWVGIAETTLQATLIKDHYPGTRIVALTPEVDYWAEETGAECLSIESLFFEREHRDLGRETIERSEAVVDIIDRYLAVFFAEKPYVSVLSFGAYFHYLNSILDGFVLRVEQIISVIRMLSPDRIVCFRMSPYKFTGITSHDHPVWGITSHLLPIVARQFGIGIDWISFDDSNLKVTSAKQVLDEVEPIGTKPSRETTFGLGRSLSRLWEFFSKPNHAPPNAACDEAPLLITSLSCDWGNQVEIEWQKIGGRVTSIGQAFSLVGNCRFRQESQELMGQLLEAIQDDIDFQNAFLWKGINVYEFIKEWFHTIFVAKFPNLINTAECSWRALVVERKYENAAILAGGWVGDHYIIARIANLVGLPIISAHYSGFIGYSLIPKHERFDMAWCDYFLCGGRISQSVLSEPSKQAAWNNKVKRANPLALGFPWVYSVFCRRATARLRNREDPLRVMVILNSINGDCRDLGFVTPPEIEYWRFTRRLVMTLLGKAHVEVIIKFPLRGRYPQLLTPLELWVEKHASKRVTFIHEIPFSECLESADAYAIEGPSTSLLYAVATNRPLLVYINKQDYLLDSRAADALAKRSSVFGTCESGFFRGLEAFLEKEQPAYIEPDDTFIRDFVFDPSKKNPARRIAEFIKNIV
jgi:hypothetical protein